MGKINNKPLFIILILLITLTFSACKPVTEATADTDVLKPESGQKESGQKDVLSTRVFTDSIGRNVEVPINIERIAVTGNLSQIVLFALCPDKLVGISGAWDSNAEQYLDPQYLKLPVIGQLYGGKGEINLETLLSLDTQIVIDIGEYKDGMEEDLDALQQQIGIPFVHINATVAMGDEYRMFGELLDMQEEADKLADYCDEVYARAYDIASKAEKVKLLYIAGEEGLNVIAKGSYHSEIIDLFSDNLAVVDEPSSRGTGNEVDIEQILNWNPDVILVDPDSIYSSIGDDPLMKNVTAIKNDAFYEVPEGPYNWMGFPPSVQRLLGMMWMGKLLYPEAADYDLKSEIMEYYKMFYHYDLSEEQYNTLVSNSIGKLH